MDVNSLFSLIYMNQVMTVVLLYAGPDQLLPVVSALGAIIGVLLIAWQRVVGLFRRAFQFVVEKLPARK